jgi:hypothetical protein
MENQQTVDPQVALDREKLELEREKLGVERYKAKWAAIGAIVPMVVALGTICFGIWNLQETAKTQFETKVAELAMVGPGPVEAKNRARWLAAMFRDLLPGDLEHRLNTFDPSNFGSEGGDPTIAPKKELFKAIADHPADRKTIIATWIALFPDDKWVKSLDEGR